MNDQLNLLAGILSYPQQSYKERVRELLNLLDSDSEEIDCLQSFMEFINENELAEIEEQFTRTFDMNKTACLEIGWHLYGEDYNRGEFLVKMRQALQEFHIDESVELPDHMSHCLQLLAALEPKEAKIFADEYIGRAVNIILSGLEKENPFYGLLQYLNIILLGISKPAPVLVTV